MIRNLIYDVETYPNVFTFSAVDADTPFRWAFEISPYRDDSRQLIEFIYWLKSLNARMVGFNNVGFDYPILHTITQMGRGDVATIYNKAQEIITSQDKFASMIYPSDRYITQIDLYKIHHFDNKARATSLKALEFAMQMENISDLPFPVGTVLNREQIDVLLKYNAHDVDATKRFFHESLEQIALREDLIREYGGKQDWLNANDTKIGALIFQMALEAEGIECYEYGPFGRQPKQTKRAVIPLNECIPDFVRFDIPEFARIKRWFSEQYITETKGAIKDVVARVDGIDYVFGTGGMHASVENQEFVMSDEWMIYDIDVAGLYPSIAITRGYYPEHLTPKFVKIYKEKIVDERRKYPKGTAKNAAYKLAGNGAYGKSNDKFSIFYDPRFTMQVTISGQMMITMLAEKLLSVPVKVIQCNTDGITMYVRREDKPKVDQVCSKWEQLTGLVLEYAEYSKMVIADVNSYLAVGVDGKVKMKGRYDWKKVTGGQRDWHKDTSFSIVPRVAEQVLLHGAPIRKTLEEWPDIMDFMGRVKVPRSSHLVLEFEGNERPLENTQRYYVSKGGGRLVKIMPPLAKKPNEWRRIGIESGWTVCPCNNIKDAVLLIDYDYYQNEVEKLCLSVT